MAIAAIAAAACTSAPEVATHEAALLPSVRISEIHYDNTGADTGEAIELSGPAGMDLTGWKVVLYNGNGGVTYTPTPASSLDLTGVIIPATCGDRGVVKLNAVGLQNGGTATAPQPDGLALVNGTNGTTVVEFLSYEGTFVATNGEAIGLTSVDIGVFEAGTEAVGLSLQRSAADTWSGPIANTFDACNDNGTPPPPNEVASVTVTPSPATITAGGTQQFTAAALDAQGQPVAGVSFTWSSDATGVATVNGSGLATGVAAGSAHISAAASTNGVSGSASLTVNAPPPPAAIRFNELHYDNFDADVGEAIEVEGPAGADLTGFTVVLYNGNGGVTYDTDALPATIPANCTDPTRGVVVINYPANGIQNGSPDGMALVNGTQVLEFLSYEGTFVATNGPAMGMTSVDIGAQENSSPVGKSLQRNESNGWTLLDATFGTCNDGTPPPPQGNTITFTGRTPTDPPLPVGFEDQLFATLRDPNNAAIPTTFTWVSETPAIASIDQNGVMRSLAEGSATVRATAALDGTTATFTLPTRVAVASQTALYADNTEFGAPTDADPSDDFIIVHDEYTSSYNVNRGSPNWVAYEIDPTHFGPEDRCDCFTFDPALPTSFPHLDTNDYTGAGAFAGYGIDRGHLARSFDRTSASLDNAFTFYMSNIVPQAADLNQGPWAIMENFLGDLVRTQDKEVYVIAGVAGNKGTLKGEGKIVIPTSTWKVAVVMPHDKGLADVHDYRDLEVIAVNMPNDPGVRNNDWHMYLTTVDAIEALTGYDLLAKLPDKVENAVEANLKPPIAAVDGPYATNEGGTVAVSAAGSVDGNGTVVSYAWDFGDGQTGEGAALTHTYAQDGSYTVTVTVTDDSGLTDTATTTATVANVAPAIGDFAGATLLPGESYTASGTFTDPGADSWTATVDWGDGSAPQTGALPDHTFSVSHTYRATGVFTVTLQIADDDVTSQRTQTVTVLTLVQAVDNAIALVDGLVAAGKLDPIAGLVLKVQLTVARTELARGHNSIALAVLRAVNLQVDLLVRVGRVSAPNAEPLRTLLARIIRSITG